MNDADHTGRFHRPGRWALMCFGFLVVALVLGGASAHGELANMVLQIVAVIFGTFAVARLTGQGHDGPTRFAFFLIAAIVGLTLLQMVPLPAGIWAAMPGRGQLAADAALLGTAVAAPLSLTPLRTVDALYWMVPPIVAFLAFLSCDEEDRRWFPLAVLLLAGFSLAVGVLQSAGMDGLRLHGRFAAANDPVGWFRNRNHQGLLMVLAVAALGFGILPRIGGAMQRALVWAAMLGFVVFAALTGSRAAMGLGVATLAIIFVLAARRQWGARIGTGWILGGGVLVVAAFALLVSLTPQFDRLADKTANLGEDIRIRAIAPTAQLVGEFFPTGTGFGSFDPVFRWRVPELSTGASFVNHAHNDYLEIALTGGLPAMLIFVAFLIWLGGRIAARRREGGAMGRVRDAALAIIALAMLHSLIDYPLRTAALASLFAACCALLLAPSVPAAARRRPRTKRQEERRSDRFDISALGNSALGNSALGNSALGAAKDDDQP